MSYGGYGNNQNVRIVFILPDFTDLDPQYGAPRGAPPAPGGGPPGYDQGYGAPPGGAPGRGYGGPPGGFSQAPPAGAPPGSDPQLWNWFQSVDLDRSGHISASELREWRSQEVKNVLTSSYREGPYQWRLDSWVYRRVISVCRAEIRIHSFRS